MKECMQVTMLPLSNIDPDPEQPRKYFDEEKMQELLKSIESEGIKNPIHVKLASDSAAEDKFIIVAGERRWRCCKQLGHDHIPAFIMPDNTDAYVWSLVENMVRASLTPIEEAYSFKRLIEERGMKQVDISRSIGKSQAHVCRRLQLLQLPESLIKLISRGTMRPVIGNILVNRCKSKDEMISVMSILGRKRHGVTKVRAHQLNSFLDKRDRLLLVSGEENGKKTGPRGPRSPQRVMMLEAIATAAHLTASLHLLTESGSSEAFALIWNSIDRRDQQRLIQHLQTINEATRALVYRLQRKPTEERPSV